MKGERDKQLLYISMSLAYSNALGVGPAKAVTLIREHRSIEEIIKKGKVGNVTKSSPITPEVRIQSVVVFYRLTYFRN